MTMIVSISVAMEKKIFQKINLKLIYMTGFCLW